MRKIILIVMCWGSVLKAGNWHFDYQKNPEEGWHFYNEKIPPLKEKGKAPQKALSPTEKVKAITERLHHLKAVMVLEPTVENIKAYQSYQKKIMDQSIEVASGWQKSLLLNPHLDARVERPASHMGQQVTYQQNTKDTQKKIYALRHQYGLYYIFSGTCPYCKKMDHIVKMFSEKYGWTLYPVQIGDVPSAAFPNANRGEGFVKKLGIKHLPALIAFNPQNKKMVPIAFGLRTLDEIEMQLMVSMGGLL